MHFLHVCFVYIMRLDVYWPKFSCCYGQHNVTKACLWYNLDYLFGGPKGETCFRIRLAIFSGGGHPLQSAVSITIDKSMLL